MDLNREQKVSHSRTHIVILVPRALLTRGATYTVRRGALAKSISELASDWLVLGYCFLTMFLWYPVMDLARAPRRTAREKGSGYENES